jgi:hypothetical protein
MASTPPASASAGDKRKAVEEKDPDFDLVRNISLEHGLKMRAACAIVSAYFSCLSCHDAVCCAQPAQNQAARRRQGSRSELHSASIQRQNHHGTRDECDFMSVWLVFSISRDAQYFVVY